MEAELLIMIAIVCHGQPMSGVQDTEDTHIHIYLPLENKEGAFHDIFMLIAKIKINYIAREPYYWKSRT